MDKEELTEWLWMVITVFGVCAGVLMLWYIGWEVTKHILGG